MKYFIYLLPFLLLLNSCAVHHTGSYSPASVVIDYNYKVVKTITGSSEVSYFLNLGGFGTDRLFFDARNNMQTNYPLKDYQKIINITTDINDTYIIFPLYHNKRVIITADVIEPINKSQISPPSQKKDGIIIKKEVSVINKNYERLDSIQNNNADLIFKKYRTIQDAKKGDIVRYLTNRNMYIYGIINSINSKKRTIKFTTYPNPTNEYINEERYRSIESLQKQ